MLTRALNDESESGLSLALSLATFLDDLVWYLGISESDML